MATTTYRIAELVHKHMTGSLSERESIELNQILTDPAKRKLFEELIDWPQTREQVKIMSEADTRKSWLQIQAAYPFHNKNTVWKKLAVAAALVLVAGGVTWYTWHKSAQQVVTTVNPAPVTTRLANNDPPSRKGVWKRAAGLAVYLDDLKNGIVGYSDKMPVIKNDSELVYPAVRSSNIPLSDTVETLPGGYYRLQLPDGSKVVLNNASTVLFASAFGSNERQVSVTGEAYFDVVKDGRPFYVKLPGLKIEVHGTQFNVQAYKEEGIVRTTLVAGAVKVKAGTQEVLLKPGEQAVFTKKKKLEKVTDPAAVKKATAWKSGTFVFENDDIKTIIGQLCRNYNLEVEYKGTIPNKTFYGFFYRNDPVELILGYLHDRSGIQFTKEGNKIIVQP